MKKLLAALSVLVISTQSFAWTFTETSVYDRSYEVKNEWDATIVVNNVKCTKTDGYDSLHLTGYFSPTGKWNEVNKTYAKSNIKKSNQYVDDVLPAYMKFCAMVNKLN